MLGQLSIFDYMKPKELYDLSEAEMIKRLSERTGLNFIYVPLRWTETKGEYKATVKKAEFTAGYDCYADSMTRFIAIEWAVFTSGGGSPCDSIDEAVERLKYYIEYAQKEEKRILEDRKKERKMEQK